MWVLIYTILGVNIISIAKREKMKADMCKSFNSMLVWMFTHTHDNYLGVSIRRVKKQTGKLEIDSSSYGGSGNKANFFKNG